MAKKLAHRIRRVQHASGQAAAQLQPAAQAAQPAAAGVSGSAASPDAVSTMPEAQVLVYPAPGGAYSTLAYQGLEPMFTTDGAVIPASNPGSWGQLRMAGRP